MNKWTKSFLTCALLYSHNSFAEHKVSIAAGTADFVWREFKENIDDSKGFLNREDGALPQFDFTYGYSQKNQNIAFTYTKLAAGVDYQGYPASGNGSIGYTTTDYDMQQITGEYGAEFEVDYVKPYAAIIGGYHQRERIINATSYFTSRLAEKYTYYFWGARLEAEIFDWNNLSIDIGGQFTHTFKGKNHLIDYNADVILESMNGINYYAHINYAFLSSWSASLKFLKSDSKMDKSNSVPIEIVTPKITLTGYGGQPESKQKITYIGISLSKSF